jgi:hypothetical protein
VTFSSLFPSSAVRNGGLHGYKKSIYFYQLHTFLKSIFSEQPFSYCCLDLTASTHVSHFKLHLPLMHKGALTTFNVASYSCFPIYVSQVQIFAGKQTIQSEDSCVTPLSIKMRQFKLDHGTSIPLSTQFIIH